MRTSVTFLLFAVVFTCFSQSLKVPGIKWDDNYSFDKYNQFEVQFFSGKSGLMKTITYTTYYQSKGDNFAIELNDKNNTILTILDKTNEVAVQKFGGGSAEPLYNTTKYKYPSEAELKKLELIPTDETREILGYPCKKYTFTYKKIFGEVWITDAINMPNDIGIFRASKMMSIHNTFSVGGFVMEIVSKDAKGGKTVMATKSLFQSKPRIVDLSGVDMKMSINKVSYFTFN